MTYLRKLRTVTGTGISFIIFMAWGFLLGVVLFPAVRLFHGARARKIFHRQVRLSWQIFNFVMQITGAFSSIKVTGQENIPKDRPCLLIGNHLTLIDIVALGARVPDFNCVVKMGLWNHPFFGAVVKACDFIPNVASVEFIEKCRTSFNENRPLIIFPQGERTLPEVPIKFQRGAAQIAVRTGVDISVVPVIFQCTPLTLAKKMRWYQSPPSPRLTIHIQPPLPAPTALNDDEPIPLKVRELTKHWEDYFEREIGKQS